MLFKKKKTPIETAESLLIIDKATFQEKLKERIQIGIAIHGRQIYMIDEEIFYNPIDFSSLLEECLMWDSYNLRWLSQVFNNPNNEYKAKYDEFNFNYRMQTSGSDIDRLKRLKNRLLFKIKYLHQLDSEADLIKSKRTEKQPVVTIDKDANMENNNNNDIFIVHGHDEALKFNVVRTLEKLGLNPIILHEQPNAGRTIIEKFEKYSSVGFAIVLLTDDDLGRAKVDDLLNKRSRQNVILELGFFIGKLGRERVCPLYIKGVELPSDLYGLVYLEVEPSGAWKINMARELKNARYKIDLNNIII